MNYKSQLILFTSIALLATVLPVQYEIREYLRYTEGNYWPFIHLLYYAFSAALGIVAFAGGIFLLLKHKTLKSAAPVLIILTGIMSVVFTRSLTTTVYKKVILNNGLYADSLSGKILNGLYKDLSQWDGNGTDDDCIKEQFRDGIPVGKWMYSWRGELIHTGKYVDEAELKSTLQELSKSKRVDIDCREEGVPLITVELIYPEVTDTLTIEKIADVTLEKLKDKYHCSGLFIEKITKEKTLLKRIDL